VPRSAARERRLRSAPPWCAIRSIAASSSFALASLMYRMVHVPDGTEDFGPRPDQRDARRGVRTPPRRRDLAALVAARLVPVAGQEGRRARRATAVPDHGVPLGRGDRRARTRPPVRVRAARRTAAEGLRRVRRPRAGRRGYGDP